MEQFKSYVWISSHLHFWKTNKRKRKNQMIPVSSCNSANEPTVLRSKLFWVIQILAILSLGQWGVVCKSIKIKCYTNVLNISRQLFLWSKFIIIRWVVAVGHSGLLACFFWRFFNVLVSSLTLSLFVLMKNQLFISFNQKFLSKFRQVIACQKTASLNETRPLIP